MKLSREDIGTLSEACYMAIAYLEWRLEEYMDYDPEDRLSMTREIAEYEALGDRLSKEYVCTSSS